jgi:hypothetical protein
MGYYEFFNIKLRDLYKIYLYLNSDQFNKYGWFKSLKSLKSVYSINAYQLTS